jgi:hypothetical protein
MKRQIVMLLALCAALIEIPTYPEEAVQENQTATSSAKLTAQELAFIAKLSDANRKVFTDKFTVEERQLVIKAAKKASVAHSADEAVERMLNSSLVDQLTKPGYA